MFSAENISEGLETEVVGKEIFTFETLASTNDDLMERARAGAAEGVVVVADKQTKGRGRFDRSWSSPSGCNLYFSILLRPRLFPAALPQITLTAAVSLCETLRAATNLEVQIKWPNDLWIGRRKICGILTEMTTRGETVEAVVLGIGLNVNMEDPIIPEALQGIATSLSCEAGRRFDRARLLQKLLVSLDRDYRLFLREGFEPFRKRFAERSLTRGRDVTTSVSGREVFGRTVGVSRNGGLLIREKDGRVLELHSGEVSFSS